jgi:hypothetical protein
MLSGKFGMLLFRAYFLLAGLLLADFLLRLSYHVWFKERKKRIIPKLFLTCLYFLTPSGQCICTFNLDRPLLYYASALACLKVMLK